MSIIVSKPPSVSVGEDADMGLVGSGLVLYLDPKLIYSGDELHVNHRFKTPSVSVGEDADMGPVGSGLVLYLVDPMQVSRRWMVLLAELGCIDNRNP